MPVGTWLLAGQRLASHRSGRRHPPCLLSELGTASQGPFEGAIQIDTYLVKIARRYACRWVENKMHRQCYIIDRYDDHRLRSVGLLISPARSPEGMHLESERRKLVRTVLGQLSERDRQIQERFYLCGQSQEEIQQAMDLTPNQGRLLRNRAKMKAIAVGASFLRPSHLRCLPPRAIALRART
jgi:RNA polymerase sigma factor (sigma-70 family)